MSFFSKLFGRNKNHKFSYDGTCTKCGCTQTAIESFGWTICQGARQKPSFTSQLPPPNDTSVPTPPETKEHIFSAKGTCTKCGCSQTAIEGFGWTICQGARQKPSFTSQPPSDSISTARRPQVDSRFNKFQPKHAVPALGTAAIVGILQRQQMLNETREIQSELRDINNNLQDLGDGASLDAPDMNF